MNIQSGKKNIAIIVLTILCLVLLLMLSNNSKAIMQNNGKFTTYQITNGSNKLSTLDIIKSASIHGISLNTPADKIDELIAKSPFECRFNEQKETNEKKQITSLNKFWRCNHKNFKGAELTIDAVDNKITKINRNGPSARQTIDNVRDMLDALKIQMKSRENFQMSDSQKSTVFGLTDKTDENIASSISYRMQILRARDPQNPPPHDGMLSVALVHLPKPPTPPPASIESQPEEILENENKAEE